MLAKTRETVVLADDPDAQHVPEPGVRSAQQDESQPVADVL